LFVPRDAGIMPASFFFERPLINRFLLASGSLFSLELQCGATAATIW
jgi:hypothetical protein